MLYSGDDNSKTVGLHHYKNEQGFRTDDTAGAISLSPVQILDTPPTSSINDIPDYSYSIVRIQYVVHTASIHMSSSETLIFQYELVATSGYLYATLGSTIAWCCVITLAVSAFQAKFKESDTYSPKRRRFLLFYVTLMTGISTAALLQHILSFRCLEVLGSISRHLTQPKNFHQLSCPIQVIVIYGVMNGAFDVVIIVDTIGVNFALSIMITCRLLVHERAMNAVLGEERKVSPFKKVMAICVESCALIILCGSVFLGTYLPTENIDLVAERIASTIMAHICVISPLLLIVRVANGRAHSTTIPSFSTEGPDFRNDSARHNYPTSTVAWHSYRYRTILLLTLIRSRSAGGYWCGAPDEDWMRTNGKMVSWKYRGIDALPKLLCATASVLTTRLHSTSEFDYIWVSSRGAVVPLSNTSSAASIPMSSSPDQYAHPFELCAVLVSTIAWFCVIKLAVHALQAIFKKSDAYSPKRRGFLLCYVVVMTGISTAALAEYILSFRCRMISLTCEGIRNLLGDEVSIFLPLPLAIF
ncbi:hypothetical protein BJ912DRAFT_1050034, partial [Pholiota molesta]